MKRLTAKVGLGRGEPVLGVEDVSRKRAIAFRYRTSKTTPTPTEPAWACPAVSQYYTPGVREICHDVKHSLDAQGQAEAIYTIAAYFINTAPLDSSSVIVPAPQHTGEAEYTKDIAEIVADQTGSTVLDIVKSEPHKSLYDQKQMGNSNLDLNFYIVSDVPDGYKVFFLDNVISTGETIFRISETLGCPVIPLVYAIDDTRFSRWDELEDMISRAYEANY